MSLVIAISPHFLNLNLIIPGLVLMGQSPQKGTERCGVTCKSSFFSMCFYSKKLLHVYWYMVMDYKIIVGQAPILFLNPSSSLKVLGLSRRNVFFNCIVLCPIFSYFIICKWLSLILDMKI